MCAREISMEVCLVLRSCFSVLRSCFCVLVPAFLLSGNMANMAIAQSDFPVCVNGAASDPDGDGFGFENNASCLVANSSGTSTQPQFPICVNGAASDPDGDGFGFENNATCLVEGSSGTSTGTSTGTSICNDISHANLTSALQAALADGNGGLDFAMWVTLVDRQGAVCHVSKANGVSGDDPWPGSRVISAQKANTANSFSNRQLALSTANLFAAVQPGNSLFGLQFSNPVDTSVAYRGAGNLFGSPGDPMTGGRIGGVNVFGGGVALYLDGEVVGAIGVSGDTSCADHNVAWRTRAALSSSDIDYTPSASGVGGVGPGGTDDIIFDSAGGDGNGITDGFEHAENCPGNPLVFVPNTTDS